MIFEKQFRPRADTVERVWVGSTQFDIQLNGNHRNIRTLSLNGLAQLQKWNAFSPMDLIRLRQDWDLCCNSLFVHRWLCLTLCHFVLVFSVLLALRLPRLGEERANLSAFRTFVRSICVLVSGNGYGLWLWHSLDFSHLFFFFFFFFFWYMVFV